MRCRRCEKEREIHKNGKYIGMCKSCSVYIGHNKEKGKERCKLWREQNRDYWREYYHKNKKKLNHRVVDWRRKNNYEHLYQQKRWQKEKMINRKKLFLTIKRGIENVKQ